MVPDVGTVKQAPYVRSSFGVSGELSRGERLQIMLSPGDLRAINTWRFAKRMPSRALAIRTLLKRGLASEGFLEAGADQRSKDFSVLSEMARSKTISTTSGVYA